MQNISPESFIDMSQPNVDWESIIRYSDVKTNQTTGAKSVNISCIQPGGKTTRLVLQVPELMTWGVNDYEGKKFDMNMQFPDKEELESNKDVAALLQNLISLENKIKQDAIKNSRAWFGKPPEKMNMDKIDEKWTPMLRYKKDQSTGEDDTTKSPTWRIKFPYWERREEEGVHDFHCEIYDMNGNNLYLPPPNGGKAGSPVNDVDITKFIQKKSNVLFSAVNGGIWFANNNFGTTWRLHQAAVEVKENYEGKCTLFLKSKPKPKDASVPSRQPTVEVEDTDDEEDAPPKVAAPPEAVAGDTEKEPEEKASEEKASTEPEETKPTDVTLPKKKKVTKK